MPYYFYKNLQGDIISIVNANDVIVAKYSYDAWGVPTITEDTSDCNIATINPFRYRGYYYDEEIGMYYLRSRYYDPTVGRFVNADDMIFLGVNGVLSYNLFTYCRNNSISQKDNMGYAATLTYNGLTCTQMDEGFYVYHNYRFILKRFCKTYAEVVIARWGSKGKYRNMNSHRIAAELFAHEILFLVGLFFGAVSIWDFLLAWKLAKYLGSIAYIVHGAITGVISSWLLKRSFRIDVNNNEAWYKVAAFEAIWVFFPPIMW